MRILKFGGSSITNRNGIQQVRCIIEKGRKADRIIVVVSAFKGVTDTLDRTVREAASGLDKFRSMLEQLEERHISMIRSLISVQNQSKTLTQFKLMFNDLDDVLHGISLTREITDRTRDFVLGFGEHFSAFIISEFLNDHQISSSYVDARKLLKTDQQFGNARVQIEKSYQNIRNYFEDADRQKVPIVTGFIASSNSGETTTLGRGGSDYTASLLGAALEAQAIELWKDTDGMMTADPQIVSNCFVISNLSYEEAMELSHFGAEVIFPPTIQPAMKACIPIHIKNTFNPGQKGTLISTEPSSDQSVVKGVSSIDHISLLTIRGSGMIGVSGISARFFGALARADVNVIMITQSSSEHSICIAVKQVQALTAKKAIEHEFRYELRDDLVQEVQMEQNLFIAAVVGNGMRRQPGIAGQVFDTLGQNGTNVVAIAQGSSERNISVVVNRKNKVKTLNALHSAFFLSEIKTVNLFLAGVGLIGSRLLQIIREQAQELLDKHKIELKLSGVSNSKRFLIDENGIALNGWKEKLFNSNEKSDINEFVRMMAKLNLSNSIFIDCTASDEVSEAYSDILKANISIVTANKKANSSSLATYEKLQQLASEHDVAYLYETNVGAGLPVVATLKEQIVTGDKIRRIEGVFSGTLSYLFNTFDNSKPFSDVVKEAREQGLTEPDPREDLNGKDAGRKLLILVREAGIKLEFEDIDIQNVVPEEARKPDSVDGFFRALQQYDEQFQDLLEETKAEGKKLCYIARYQGEKATVKLEKIDSNHPFFQLRGSDNIIAFNTKHYQDSPIVVKGPGAGADVTASGLIADILRISKVPSFRKYLSYGIKEE
jgi:aspartokinase/homoserine dehydrogenase 1